MQHLFIQLFKSSYNKNSYKKMKVSRSKILNAKPLIIKIFAEVYKYFTFCYNKYIEKFSGVTGFDLKANHLWHAEGFGGLFKNR